MKKLLVLGPGCPNCVKLEQLTRNAAAELEINCDIQKVTDFKEIASYGAMRTPALIVDGQLKVSGRIPKIEELKELIK